MAKQNEARALALEALRTAIAALAERMNDASARWTGGKHAIEQKIATQIVRDAEDARVLASACEVLGRRSDIRL